MVTAESASSFVEQARDYWALANVLTGFYFAQALAFWYKLDDQEFASKLRARIPLVLSLLWIQAGIVGLFVYGSYRAELRLLCSSTAIAETSRWACWARIFVIVGMTALSTFFVLLATGRLNRVPKPPAPDI